MEQNLPLVKISASRRYLVTEKNSPFFWLGDTAWELFHRLNKDEVKLYFKDRCSKGFNVIQSVILAELDGLDSANAYGDKPLMNRDPAQPNEAYFNHVDYIIALAESLGLYMAVLPTWGDKFNKAWGQGPEIFTPENAAEYGEFLGNRYANAKNIIWVMGGDRIPEREVHYEIIRSMAQGIKKKAAKQLMTYHPSGGKLSSDYFGREEW